MKLMLFLGGTYHDFEGFAAAVTPLFVQRGAEVEATYDLDRLHTLEEEQVDIVVLYTCHGAKSPDGGPVPRIDEAQTEALARWVRQGGGLLPAHAATVGAQNNPALGRLLGGEFISHPPQFSFPVYPLSREHPITQEVEALAVHDEFYIQKYYEDVEILMVAMDRGVAYPMVWIRQEGAGRVAYIALGHGPRVWAAPGYQQLMVQALDWLVEDRLAEDHLVGEEASHGH